MSDINIDQQYIDQIYNAIIVQKLRYDHFNSIIPNTSKKSVWNKTNDEKIILQQLVNLYKDYYKNKAEELQLKIKEQKEYNMNSYLTYDPTYYEKNYTERKKELENYLNDLDDKNINDTLADKLNFVSIHIDTLFPGYMVTPTLFNKF